MVALQILSKVIASKDISILKDNLLTVDYFLEYQEEYQFITKHFEDYGNVPDKATFLAQFPEMELVEVSESDKYLVDGIREEYLYYKSIPVVQHIAELLKTDANAAAEYMINAVKDLEPNYQLGGVDIVAEAGVRYEEFLARKDKQKEWFFPTGFEELDDVIHGLQRGEELFVIVARINQGKSWILEKICTHVWSIGYNVGYISPEMSPTSIGFRFDTLNKHFSNKNLMWGNSNFDVDAYSDYIQNLQKSEHSYQVATPLDFQKSITITKLRNWIKQNKLDLLAIDGITYLTDERFKRGDTKTTTLTNISEDLMSLSMEMSIPIVVVSQANRGGSFSEDEDGTPELENIKDSDGIAANASKVLSIRQMKNSVLRMEIKKQRGGKVGGRLDYTWDIDVGDFRFIPSDGDAQPREKTERNVEDLKKKYSNDKRMVF